MQDENWRDSKFTGNSRYLKIRTTLSEYSENNKFSGR